MMTKTLNMLLLVAVCLFSGAQAFSVNNNKMTSVPTVTEAPIADKFNNVFPAAAVALTTLTANVGPALAAKVVDLPPDYLDKEMAASFLPAILVPIVGLIFPAFSMALFFLYTQKDDIEVPGSS